MKLNQRISAKPGKQRKNAIEAHLNEKRKFLRSRLSKELSKRYTRRNALVRKNDTVKISRGQFKGKSGKINRVDIKASRVFIDGIGFTKNDGSKVYSFTRWIEVSPVPNTLPSVSRPWYIVLNSFILDLLKACQSFRSISATATVKERKPKREVSNFQK